MKTTNKLVAESLNEWTNETDGVINESYTKIESLFKNVNLDDEQTMNTFIRIFTGVIDSKIWRKALLQKGRDRRLEEAISNTSKEEKQKLLKAAREKKWQKAITFADPNNMGEYKLVLSGVKF
jgi:hypothetical protein